MRILFAEPFYGGSHRVLLDGLSRHSRHRIEALTLPGESWRSRMRRGAQQLAGRIAEIPGSFDLLIATDMLDLPAFLALTRRRLGAVPVLLYMHENQFTYPRLRGTKLNSWFGQLNYLGALVADTVAFNSSFHRTDFLAALRTLGGQPNNWLEVPAIDVIEEKSCVLAPGIDLRALDAHRRERPPGPARLLWNHRWEFDKSPETFAGSSAAWRTGASNSKWLQPASPGRTRTRPWSTSRPRSASGSCTSGTRPRGRNTPPCSGAATWS